MADPPCPTCSGSGRETVGMVCQTCGTDYAPDSYLFPPLPQGTALHVCLICGAVIAEKGVRFHDDWHRETAAVAIASQRRLDALEGIRGGTRV